MAEEVGRVGGGSSLDRHQIQASLDRFVAANRFMIAVVFPVVGAGTLIAGAKGYVPSEFAFFPAFVLAGTIVMRLPLIAGVLPLLTRRASILLLGLCVYAYGIELVGVHTGWPYGEFSYGIDLGPMLAGVPVGLPLFFLPLVLNAYLLVFVLLGGRRTNRWKDLLVSLGVVLLIDLVLDPGAVALGFWEYAEGGVYYGVPLSNYGGWLLSGTVAVVVIHFAFNRERLLARLEECTFMLDDLVSFVLLWGLVNLAFGNWIALVLAMGLVGGLGMTDRFDVPVLS